MHVEKISENQLKVTLNLEDLKENNISLHSFMCNSAESQNLFFNILNFADGEIGFSIKNYEIIIEVFSIPIKSSFVLVITRVPKVTRFHPTETQLGVFKFNNSFWVKFNSLEELCIFCDFLHEDSNIKTSLYLLDGHYFLHITVNAIKKYFKLLTESYEFSNYVYGNDFVLDESAEVIIKDCAIEIAKKYFV